MEEKCYITTTEKIQISKWIYPNNVKQDISGAKKGICERQD
jgi:hypothetical protein